MREVSRKRQVELAIICARQVYRELEWDRWSAEWLSDKDRSFDAANKMHLKMEKKLAPDFITRFRIKAATHAALGACLFASDCSMENEGCIIDTLAAIQCADWLERWSGGLMLSRKQKNMVNHMTAIWDKSDPLSCPVLSAIGRCGMVN